MDSSHLNNNYLNYSAYAMPNQTYAMPSSHYGYAVSNQKQVVAPTMDHSYNGYSHFYQPSMPMTNSDYTYYNTVPADYNNTAMSSSLNANYVNYSPMVSMPTNTLTSPHSNLDELKATQNYYALKASDKPAQSRAEKAYSYDPYLLNQGTSFDDS